MAELTDAQLLELARPLALGALAGGFAHRATNELFAVAGLAELLLEEMPEDSPAHRQLAQIHSSGRKLQRACRLLSDLRHPSGATATSLGAVCQHAIELVRMTKTAETVEIVERYDDNAAFSGNPDMVVIALIDLLRNAEEAFEYGGTIVVETGVNGGIAFARVSDDGPPPAPEILEHMFEPFTSTKPGHAGLGLPSARAAARSLGGDLKLAATDTTSFELLLPRNPAAS